MVPLLAIAGCTGPVDTPSTPETALTLVPGDWLRVTDDPAEGAKHHATSAFRDDGVFTVAWHNGRVVPTDAWVRSYTFADRVPVGGAMPVNDPERSGRKVDVEADADGTWVTAYEDDDDMVNVTRLGPSLERIRDPVALTTFSVNHSTDVAVADDRVAVVWQSDNADTSATVYARLDASLAVDRVTVVDQGPSYACPPDISPVPGGGWLMVWCIREPSPADPEAPDADIVATVVDVDGNEVLPPFVVDQGLLPSPARPMSAVDPETGTLLFAWHSHDADHVQDGASFRAFRADGTPLTDEIPLGTAGRSHYPVVEGIDGLAIVVFEEAESDDDPARGDPELQVFDLGDGSSILGPEPFHPLAGVNQWWPSLAVAPVEGGLGVVATWASDADRPEEVDVYVGTALLAW